MSITLHNVKVAESTYSAEQGWGFTQEALHEARDLVLADAPNAAPLVAAIEEVAQSSGCLSAEHHGRQLIAATGPRTSKQKYRPIEGLMYVEGRDFNDHTFDEAIISQWVSAPNRFIAKARHLRNGSMTESRADAIRRRFYEIGLDNWDTHWNERGNGHRFWGLRVNSNTRVVPVGNQEGDIQVPFSCGDWRDMLAVSGLRIPTEKKALIIAAVAGSHAEARLEALVRS